MCDWMGRRALEFTRGEVQRIYQLVRSRSTARVVLHGLGKESESEAEAEAAAGGQERYWRLNARSVKFRAVSQIVLDGVTALPSPGEHIPGA